MLDKIRKMKKTQKYSKACEKLTFPHSTQDELYAELNRLGWYWQASQKEWVRDDRIPNEATKLVKVRVWADSKKVADAAALIIESVESNGLRLLQKSPPYSCRPPQQLEGRIYLEFEEVKDV
jgi:hypothetical protein